MVDFDTGSGTSGSFDLLGLAKKIIYEVDSIRSFSDEKSTEGLANGGYNESRVNAFFRLIGLPMFVNIDPDKPSGTILNSAYSSYMYTNAVSFTNMETVPSFVDVDNLDSSLVSREASYIEEENRTDDDKCTAMTLSLKDMIPLKPNLPDNTVGYGRFGMPSSNNEDSRSVFKMLFPLVPSYVKVNPVGRNVIRPFSDEQELYRETILKKPFLETVITMRYIFGQGSSTDQGNINTKASVENITSSVTKDEAAELSKILTSIQKGGALESFIVNQIFSSLKQICSKHAELVAKQDMLRAYGGNFTVSLQTESSKTPFGKKISPITQGAFDDSSALGQNLVLLNQKLAQEEAYLLLLTGDSSVSVSSKTNNSASSSMSSLFVDILAKNRDSIKEEIAGQEAFYKNISVQADTLRVEIDLLTGEFSGLSIIDVIAVIAGLFLIKKEDLVKLLDRESKDLMASKPVFSEIQSTLLATSLSDVKDASDAIVELQKYVNMVYSYINSTLETINDRSKRSMTVSKKPKKQDDDQPGWKDY